MEMVVGEREGICDWRTAWHSLYWVILMEYFDSKKGRHLRFMLDEPSEDDEYVYADPIEKRPPRNVYEEFNCLYVARERFMGFVE